jgi:hypothetical protein
MNRDNLDLDMYHAYIQENNIADLYLLGKLPSEESARFEIHFLSCADCVTQIEEIEALRVGLRGSATTAKAKPTARPRRFAFFTWLSEFRAWQQLTFIIATLLLVAALPAALLMREIRTLRQELNEAKATELARNTPLQNSPAPERPAATVIENQSPRAAAKPADVGPAGQKSDGRAVPAKNGSVPVQPQVNTPLFAFNAVRSGAPEVVNKILVSRKPQSFVVSLDLEGENRYSIYRATIFSGHRPIWRNGGLRPNQLNMLVMILNSSFFHDGDYQLTIEGLRPKEPAASVANYPFRITKQP